MKCLVCIQLVFRSDTHVTRMIIRTDQNGDRQCQQNGDNRNAALRNISLAGSGLLICANSLKTVAEAARVAELGVCSIPDQSISGSSREKPSKCFFRQLRDSIYHSASFALWKHRLLSALFLLLSYNVLDSGKITKGFSGSPPRLFTVQYFKVGTGCTQGLTVS